MDEDRSDASLKARELASETVRLADQGLESQSMAYGMAALATAITALAAALNKDASPATRQKVQRSPRGAERAGSYRLPQVPGSTTILDSVPPGAGVARRPSDP